MLLADGTVMGAEQPALGEAEDQVDGRQAEHGIAPGGAEIDRLVAVSLGRQVGIAGPSVGGQAAGLATSTARKPSRLVAPASGRRASRSRPSRRPRALPRPASTATATSALPAAPRPGRPGLAAASRSRRPPPGHERWIGPDHRLRRICAATPRRLIVPEPIAAATRWRRCRPCSRSRGNGEEPSHGQAGLGLLEDRGREQRVSSPQAAHS